MMKILKRYKEQKPAGNCKDCKYSRLTVYTGYLMPKDSEILLECFAKPEPWLHAFQNNGLENFDFGCGCFSKEEIIEDKK